MLHVRAIFVGQQSKRNSQAIGKHARLMWAGAVGIVEDQHLIAPWLLIKRGGDFLVVVGVDRVFERSHGPHPALGVPHNCDRFADALIFAGDKFDFESRRQSEAGALFFRCQGRLLCRFSRRRRWKEAGIGRRRRQLLDADVFDLDQSLAAAMDLNAENSTRGYVRILFVVVGGLDAIEPDCDARAISANDVVVPVIPVQNLVHCDHVGREQNATAPSFVIDRAPPIRIAQIALVARNFFGIRNAVGANLNAAIDESRSASELEFEVKNEVRVLALGAEKLVFADCLGQRAADDDAILRAPELRIAFPLIESAVEERNGIGSGRRRNCAS